MLLVPEREIANLMTREAAIDAVEKRLCRDGRKRRL